ncbi:MAG: hypothetical protein OEV28_11050 [Nitrospirota bacterium]|nr:hypothetical protein [Nitrospirota bacterium]
MKKVVSLMAAFLIVAGTTAMAAEKHSHDSHDSHAAPAASKAQPKASKDKTPNPVKDEMVALNEAFKNLLDAILLNEPEKVELPFHNVHRYKEKTMAAAKKGEIKLPKNNDKFAEFEKLDEKFHHDLEGILAAADKKDMKALTAKTHKLFDACVECHSKFRNK